MNKQLVATAMLIIASNSFAGNGPSSDNSYPDTGSWNNDPHYPEQRYNDYKDETIINEAQKDAPAQQELEKQMTDNFIQRCDTLLAEIQEDRACAEIEQSVKK